MFPLPQPLHPAVVHFPIVLLLIGAAVAVAAAFTRRWHLAGITAALLTLGALGAVVATTTGNEEEEMAGELSGQGEATLEEHEEWGETTRNLAVVTALLAIASVSIGRWPVPARVLGVVTALAAIAAGYAVAQTGHYGGQLVYRHGIGVNTASAGDAGPSAEATGQPEGEDDDDD